VKEIPILAVGKGSRVKIEFSITVSDDACHEEIEYITYIEFAKHFDFEWPYVPGSVVPAEHTSTPGEP